jgi:predicted DNA-binding transcriptional regulator YafY
MYSPTTRLFTMLEILQSYKQMSGRELARRLEVDTRTIRRYIVMLQDMGIPVEAERGPYGAYQLQRGYKLPPLMFNDAEAVALTLGLLAIRELNFPVDVAAVEGALAKTERVMPEKLFNQARALQEAITFNVSTPPQQPQNVFVASLSSAVRERHRVKMRYLSFNGEETERSFDAYGIVFNEGYWYTAGYCHLRHDLRTFRLDRIFSVEAERETFERPPDFDTLRHVLESLGVGARMPQVMVLMDTTLEHAREAIESLGGMVEATPEGVLYRRAAYQLEWVAHVLIMFDFPVKIVEPPELREMVREIGEKALRLVKVSKESDQMQGE